MDEQTAPESDIWREVSESWRRIDPDGVITLRKRVDGKAELIVTSILFEGRDSLQREALFWPALEDMPRDILVNMTYSLFLSPQEAVRFFAEEHEMEGTLLEGDR